MGDSRAKGYELEEEKQQLANVVTFSADTNYIYKHVIRLEKNQSCKIILSNGSEIIIKG